MNKIFGSFFYFISLFTVVMAYRMMGVDSLNYFIDFPSIIFIASSLTLLIVNFRITEIRQTIIYACSNSSVAMAKLESGKQILRAAWKYTLISAGVSALIGTIMALSYDNTYKIGPFLALVLISVLYVLVIKLIILLPLETSIERKIILSGDLNLN